MNIYLFAGAMLLIAASAFASQIYLVGDGAVSLLVTGLFVDRFQDHPAVQEWLERYF